MANELDGFNISSFKNIIQDCGVSLIVHGNEDQVLAISGDPAASSNSNTSKQVNKLEIHQFYYLISESLNPVLPALFSAINLLNSVSATWKSYSPLWSLKSLMGTPLSQNSIFFSQKIIYFNLGDLVVSSLDEQVDVLSISVNVHLDQIVKTVSSSTSSGSTENYQN